ncbi:MAG: hypothetical protein IT531_15245 [Burkholderiales bacterium]|nr:hypothetical protein [Burkholderiales bacterium]
MLLEEQQLSVLARSAAATFEDRTLAHLDRYFPRHCRLLGAEQMRRVIRYGWSRANAHELTPECCVRSYIDLMCVLGSGFDQDVLLPWAAAVLSDRSNADPIARGDALYDLAWAYIEHIGKDFRNSDGTPTTARFVYELKDLRDETDAALDTSKLPGFARGLEQRFNRVFPAKSARVGTAAIRQTVANAVLGAREHGIRGQRGVTVYATLLFVLGASFARDPLLPWAHAALTDPTLGDESKKVDKLFMSAVAFLRQWWEPMAQARGG